MFYDSLCLPLPPSGWFVHPLTSACLYCYSPRARRPWIRCEPFVQFNWESDAVKSVRPSASSLMHSSNDHCMCATLHNKQPCQQRLAINKQPHSIGIVATAAPSSEPNLSLGQRNSHALSRNNCVRTTNCCKRWIRRSKSWMCWSTSWSRPSNCVLLLLLLLLLSCDTCRSHFYLLRLLLLVLVVLLVYCFAIRLHTLSFMLYKVALAVRLLWLWRWLLCVLVTHVIQYCILAIERQFGHLNLVRCFGNQIATQLFVALDQCAVGKAAIGKLLGIHAAGHTSKRLVECQPEIHYRFCWPKDATTATITTPCQPQVRLAAVQHTHQPAA
jgi:hypothetical protein